jgi:hypothetical protein
MPNPVINRRSTVVPSISISALVINWANRVVINGGAVPSLATQMAMSTFTNTMDAAGLTSMMKTLNVFAPDSLAACLTPLIIGAANDPWNNVGPSFVSGDLDVNGLLGDGSSKIINTGFAPSAGFATSLSAGLSVYESTTTNAIVCAIGGHQSSSTVGLALFTNSFGTGQVLFDCWNNSTGRLVVNPGPTVAGFTSGNRVSATDSRAYFANSSNAFAQIGSTSATSGNAFSDCTQATGVFCSQEFPTNQFVSARRMSFAAIHDGLTSGQAQSLYNAVQTLRQTLGGGFV